MKRFIHRHQPKPHPRIAALAGVGAALAVGGLAFVNNALGLAMLMAPFGASCVLLFAAAASPLSQPVNVIGGHLLAAVIGIGAHLVIPNAFWAAGLAVGVAVALMAYLRVIHPPAGATTLVAYASSAGWGFLVFPVALGSLALVVIATLYHRATNTPYPTPLPERQP